MSQVLGGQPIIILKEGTTQTRGQEALGNNIAAAKAVANAVRSTLGPRGMDKMLVSGIGDIVITNDGATIVDEMDIEHPAAKMMVEIAKTQDQEAGDGTTTAVVLAGELLSEAQKLVADSVHPTVIAAGYQLAAGRASAFLDSIAKSVGPSDTALLRRIAMTAMTGKGAEVAMDQFADMIVRAIGMVVEEDGTVDPDFVKVEKKVGGSFDDSVLVEGIVLIKERVHPAMPKRVENARILLLNVPIEYRKPESNAKIRLTAPGQEQAFIENDERMSREIAEKVIRTGANVILSQKGIDDLAQHHLAKAGILAVRRLKTSDLKRLARATGASIMTTLDDIQPESLGYAGLVEERIMAADEVIVVERCQNPRAVTILLHGGTEHAVDELERAVHDAVRVVGVVVEDGKYVVGGGAPEIALARDLREFAVTIGGREQLAVEAFARALEAIPRTIAENAGIDPVDALVALRAAHEAGDRSAGIDILSGEASDMEALGIVEPLRVKKQAIASATEAAVMILRIDDIIASSKEQGSEGEAAGDY
ncbi:MAG TPA: thermosome subunit alpha [Methanoregulaceae archaeon]|nr:thermosome subunit alpha [Methanoregulaceae archaeon]HQJ87724.1 thermosome subunit alpha [Methanoregulaceae archaeon]